LSYPRIIIIGLDGVPLEMIESFAATGVMPNTQSLIDEGVLRKMRSSIPEISSVAWSSMITGRNPGEHGIFGFTDLFERSYKMRFPNFSDLKAAPFWEDWPGKSIIINVPSTYPVRRMNGVHISGFVSIDMERSVYPQSLVPKLNELDYRLDVDSQKAHSSMELFLADVDKTLDARIRACEYLWDYTDWQTFMPVFTGTDRLMHFLWNAYEDDCHEYHGRFVEHFRKIDAEIGRITQSARADDVIVMHSDHGFERLDCDVNINFLLGREGFLVFADNEETTLKNMCGRTRAFALDPSRIYLHREGRYPGGCVSDASAEDVLKDIEDMFDSLEIDGRKVIRSIYRREDIYRGPQCPNAPDMVLVAEEGFNLRANMRAKAGYEKGIFTGKHTLENAFLLIKGINDAKIVPEKPEISDIRRILELHNPALADNRKA
jgi:predicted AlkP superfamily phosphohydrolase/phosphomutase